MNLPQVAKMTAGLGTYVVNESPKFFEGAIKSDFVNFLKLVRNAGFATTISDRAREEGSIPEGEKQTDRYVLSIFSEHTIIVFQLCRRYSIAERFNYYIKKTL
jgi:hypothetical protein